ncbi:MAG: amino acid adenylation domain-containing protein, partial [Actinomycetota bacterium]|nr:amino acid adenylation domain-containing protein [Actinomycetota bacterium]
MTSRSVVESSLDAGLFDLSAAQSELWLAQELHPTVPFSISQYTDLSGPVDVGLLEHCTRQASRELQSPHVRFALTGGIPRQYLDHDTEAGVDRIDLSDEPDPELAARQWMHQDHQRRIDLTGPDIARAVLFTLGPDRHLCYGRTHHIAVDGYGAGQLLARGAELYSAATTGLPAPQCRAMPLSAIAAADLRYRASARFAADREYWREQLDGLTRVTRLSDRYAAPTANPHITHTTLDAAAMTRLDTMAGRAGAGMAEVLVATVAAFLAQMTGDTDITVSLPVAARTTSSLRRSAGMVSNVVPLRIRGVATSTVDDLVRHARLTIIGALRHQLYRHEDLLRDHGIGVAARNGYGPLVNVLTFPDTIAFGAARGRAHLLSAGPVDDVTINCYRFGTGPFAIDFFANPERYSADELGRYHEQFIECLNRFLNASGTTKVVDLTTRTRAIASPRRRDRRPLLPDLLDGGIGSGERVAVRGQGSSLTYRELDELSAQWARELIACGAGPEVVVAVALPRSVETIVALWAVARAGAVFFPLDPSGPPERVSRLISDSRAALGITRTSWLPSTGPSTVEWLVLDSDEFISAVATRPVTAVTDAERSRPLRAAHPAYLIYTSGSTGEPKGVLNTHEGLAALRDDLVDRYRIGPDSVVAQSHSPYCDASVLEYFAAFGSGASLVVPAPDIVAGERLARIIADHAVTHLLVTPTILTTLDSDSLPSLQTVAVGGDKCSADVAAHWGARVRMFNSYGPTEATVIVTHTDPLDPDSDVVPIGRALPGVRLCVLDARLRPAPLGARGELYLAGDAVARGYLGRPSMTAQCFVANPLGPAGSRMYRTGDVVRERPDGTMEYLGRSDVQISLRGQRIEPSEVERALTADVAVDQAAVRMWSSEKLGDRLIGYIVPAEAGVDRTAVLARLRRVLPPAMIPAMLVVLAEMPINPSSGKADRSALPDPESVARPAYRAPTTPVEIAVADAIGEITGVARVGLDDNFFELGGNSLLGVELCQKLSARTGTIVPMSQLFTPTVQTLSSAVESAMAGHDSAQSNSALDTVLPLRSEASGAPLICLPSAVPLSWCYSGLLNYVGDRPIIGLQSPGSATAAARCRSVADLAQMYRRELARLPLPGPYHLLGWSLGGQLAHALAIALREDGYDVGLLVMLDSVAFAEGAPAPTPPTLRDLVTHLEGNESDTPDESPLTLDEAVELLAQSSGPGRGLTRSQLDGLHQGYVDCVEMSVAYRPARFDGDLLYFSARNGITGSLSGEMWRPYVSGRIVEHGVDVTHAQ